VTSQREVQRMKDDFVGLVSHELRTPLTAIYGFAELLLDRERLSDTGRTYLETMYKEAGRMTKLVNDFLDVERFASGRMSFHFGPVRLDEVIAEARENLGSQLARHSLVAETSLDPIYARADKDRLLQVLLNLLSNALKYSPDGGEVRVQTRVERSHVVISVTDSGLGLPPEALPRLFEKFYRVEDASHRSVGGTGLGLAICKEIAEAMGGHIWAESPGVGQGSTFSFTLPLAGIPVVRAADTPLTPARGRILLANDDPGLAAIILEQLGPLGYAVEAVSSGEEAICHVRADKPAAVVLDVCLPGKPDGWGVLAALRDDSATAEVPVIVISGQSDEDQGLLLGPDEFLVKPVASHRLLSTVRRLAGVDRGGPIVVADDDPRNRAVLQSMLTDAGFTVTAVGDGEAALSAIQQQLPLAVLLDINLGKVDTLTVLEKLRTNARLCKVPVLMFTARDLTEQQRDQLRTRTSEVLRNRNGVGSNLAVALRRSMGLQPSPQTAASAPRRELRLLRAAGY
jgi:CheY-like chemotaxis protein